MFIIFVVITRFILIPEARTNVKKVLFSLTPFSYMTQTLWLIFWTFVQQLLTETTCPRSSYERVSLTSGNWRKPFFTQFESMFNRTIDQDLVNRLFVTNSLTRFLKPRQLCYLLPYRTATPRFNKHQGLIIWKYRANILNCLLTKCSSHIRRTDILKKSSVDCSRIAEKSWKWKILLEVKTRKQLQNFTALWNLLERYMASSFFSLSLTLFCQLQHFWGILWSSLPFARTHQFIRHPNSCIVT